MREAREILPLGDAPSGESMGMELALRMTPDEQWFADQAAAFWVDVQVVWVHSIKSRVVEFSSSEKCPGSAGMARRLLARYTPQTGRVWTPAVADRRNGVWLRDDVIAAVRQQAERWWRIESKRAGRGGDPWPGLAQPEGE